MRIGTRPITRKPGKANPIVLGLLFVVIGGFALFMWGLHPLKYVRTAKNWPSVPGEITRSEIETYRKNGKNRYLPDVSYMYSVNDENYTSSKVTVGDPPYTYNISSTNRLQAECQVGSRQD